MSPSPNIGGTCPPCPIGIDAPVENAQGLNRNWLKAVTSAVVIIMAVIAAAVAAAVICRVV